MGGQGENSTGRTIPSLTAVYLLFLICITKEGALERTPAALYVLCLFKFYVLLYSPVPSFEGRAEVGDTESSPTLYCIGGIMSDGVWFKPDQLRTEN